MNVSRILILVLALSLAACGEEVGFSTAPIDAAPEVTAQAGEGGAPAAEQNAPAAEEDEADVKPVKPQPPSKFRLPLKRPKPGCH